MKYCIIITAAGMSTRQKQNKLLIRSCHETIIEKTINTFNSLNLDIFVVVGYEKDKLIPVLIHRFGNDIKLVDNDRYKTGIASSIKAGLLAAGKKYNYYGFCNGDKPFIKTKSVKNILGYIEENNPTILVPIYQEKSGHPTFFSNSYIEYFNEIGGDIGGKEVIDKFPKSVTYLPINDKGIILDMDEYLNEE